MSRRRRMRRNPEGGPSIVKIGLGLGVAYLAYRFITDGSGKPVAPNMPSMPMPVDPMKAPNVGPMPVATPAPMPSMPVQQTLPEATTVSAEIYGEPTEYEVATTYEASGMKGLGSLGDHRPDGKGIFAGTLFG